MIPHTCGTCGRNLPMHRKPKARACSRRCAALLTKRLVKLARRRRHESTDLGGSE